MNKTQRAKWGARVGKAYRTPTGNVRWIISMSTIGNYRTRWLHEETNTWHEGGRIHAGNWHRYDGQEVPAPQPGDTVKITLTFGGTMDVVVGEGSFGLL